MAEQNNFIRAYSDREMTQFLCLMRGPKLCKKVLQIVALVCEKPVKNLRTIDNDILIGSYDIAENGNYYVEVLEKANSNEDSQSDLDHSQQSKCQFQEGQKNKLSLGIQWGYGSRKSRQLKNLSKTIFEQKDDEEGA